MKLSNIDWWIILLCVCLFLGISYYFSKKNSDNVFSENGKLSWWLASSSIIIIYWNPSLDMINTGLVVSKGYSGLWFTKDILLTIGIAPILFVPMWARLKLTTDNELIRLRFYGKGAKLLQLFRAIYVGLFISSFLISFYILGIRKILDAIITISDTQFLIGLVTLIPLIILKNSFHTKIRTDAVITILYLLTISIGIIFLIQHHGGWSQIKEQLINNDKISMLPTSSDTTESFSNWFVFLFVQWWSVRILDHSNPNSQRHFAVGDSWNAFKAMFIAVIVISVMFGLSSFVWDVALLQQSIGQDYEGLYFKLLLEAVPLGIKGLILVVFIFGFITTIESTLSWGASFLSIDVFKTYIKKNALDTQVRLSAFLFMGLIFSLSVIIYSFSAHLIGLQKILFSMSAGVGLVFILRWFWWRVNAWSQISAMLSSLIYTLFFEMFYKHSDLFQGWINALTDISTLSYYSLKICILTILVTITWLSVTFLTPADPIHHLKKFTELTKTGGFWPFKTERFSWKRRTGLILLFAIQGLLPIWIIWHFKFAKPFIGIIDFTLAGYFIRDLQPNEVSAVKI